ncbi:hypothetical protein GF378_03245 [Candidatus Pacearchaeota archaeon]|nr:hypothetical protein [Candidatus Pacearchaeota archaeon]
MIKEDKRGQFYLLAAIILIVIISGFAAVSNYTRKQSSIKLYDVRNELGIESGKVLDYGTLQGEFIEEDVHIIDHFTEKYNEYAGEDKKIFFIFGGYEKITLITYGNATQGDIELIAGGSQPITTEIPRKQIIKQTITPEGGEVTVKIGENKYPFELKPGENFYFIISQKIGEEQVVVTS